MGFIKIKEFYNLIVLLTISIIPKLIKCKNLCPYHNLDDSLHYYAKGINPTKCSDCNNYTWEYIHCVNNYYNSTYLLRDQKDDYFNKNAGIFIGSSINLGRLTEDFISNNLTKLNGTDRDNLIQLIDQFGEKAEQIYSNITFNFTLNEIDYINEQVYTLYYKEMLEFFDLDNERNLRLENYGYTLKITLLTFFVKYYGMMDYLHEVQQILKENTNNNLILLSNYFLNIPSDNYYQKKLWSMTALSSDVTYSNNNVSHIGIYHDAKLDPKNQKAFKGFLKLFVNSFDSKDYYYSLANLSGLYFDTPLDKEKFYNKIDEYDFYCNGTKKEDLNKSIQIFQNVFNETLKGINSFYQKHLIIFIHFSIDQLKNYINIEHFIRNGIQVILVAKVNEKSEETLIRNIFRDNFTIITFNNYRYINSSLSMLRSVINFNVQNYYLNSAKFNVKINNILTSTKDNMQYFKINVDNNTIKSNDFYKYIHISLIYNDVKKIESLYKNNSNITFLVSHKNPYVDITSYDIANFCFNTTVSSDIDKSPYINYIINDTKEDFIYVTIMANDMNYSLDIHLLSSPYEPKRSNGEFEKNSVNPYFEELIATFDDKLIQRRCFVDYFSFLKYFSSGVHYKNNDDIFNKIIDMNMMECLYKNVYCPFFEMDKEQTRIKYEEGPLIGYGINISKESYFNLTKSNISLYLINKLYPFLSNSLDKKKAKETLENFNMHLTYEENNFLNIHYLANIINNLQKSHKKFTSLSDNIKLAIVLRIIEQHPTNNQIEHYLDYLTSNNIKKYLEILNNTAKTRMSTEESLNFQMMLTLTKNINKPKKCLLSMVIGKSLIKTEQFQELILKINSYRLSITYYDEETNQVILLEDFNENINEIIEKIDNIEIKKESNITRKINTDLILKQQMSLFKYYDEGIKKCIVFISSKYLNSSESYYTYAIPDKTLLEELNDKGILIFDYSDHINFILDEKNGEYNFFNSTKSEFIQFVPFLNINDMGKNYLSLSNMINRYPIPVNTLEDIYLDLEPDEEICYEINLDKVLNKIRKKNNLYTYNQLKFNFDTPGFKIYFSDKFIFPNNYSNQAQYIIEENAKSFYYEIKNDNRSSKFYMSISTSDKVDNSFFKFDLCNKEGTCLKNDFNFKFYIAFIVIGGVILIYGIYIFFFESTFKKESKESNIFKRN